MSATLDSELFCSFFNGAPFFKIEGRTFPVKCFHLEDIFEATGTVIEEDSRYALRNFREGSTTSMWVTTKGGEKKRTVVDLESQLDSLQVSDDYESYSMTTRRSMEIVNEEVINFELIEDLLSLLLVNTHENTMLLSPSSENGDGLSNGSVLVFLPGIGEIRELNDLLKSSPHFGDETRFDIIPMHSTISPKEQKRAFATPPKGVRKIVLSTNIAETSVTIADCICVIDAGFERQIVQSRGSSTSTLKKMWCSRASAKQRAGRAGRVQAGICCKLYSSKTANYTMKKQSAPELQRIPLEEVCLSILAGNLSDNCMDFLLQAPQPPTNEAVQSALQVLEEVGAIEPFATKKNAKRQEKLTALGRHLAKLPVHVRLGKMLLYGSIFGVLDSILTIVSFLSSKSPFVTNIDNSSHIAAAHKAFEHYSSDFLTPCKVWEAYNKALEVSQSNARKFCVKNFLNRSALIEVGECRKQFFQLLLSLGFIDPKVKSLADLSSMTSSCNRNKLREEIVDAAITSGLYPNIAHVSKDSSGEITLYSMADKVHFHKSSTNHKKKLSAEWIVYQEKFATTRTFVNTSATIHPFSLLIFGQNLHVKHTEQKVVIDDWIEVGIQSQNAVMIREMKYSLQKELEQLIAGEVKHNDDSTKIINGICRLLSLSAQ